MTTTAYGDLLDRLERRLVVGSRLVETPDAVNRAESPAPGGAPRHWSSASVAQAVAALDLAVEAQPVWAATPLDDRIAVVTGYLDGLLRDAERIANLIVLETGKTITDARAEVAVSAGVVRELVGAARSGVFDEEVTLDGAVRLRVRPVPVGPALLVTPWNFPLSMASRKVVSALLSGCTAILKPSERSPLTALALGSLLIDSGLPAGVLSVLPSVDSAAMVAALTGRRELRKISFTGSTAVGRKVLEASTGNFQHVSLELGGNAPCVILPDADVRSAVQTIWSSKLFNNGQACTAPNRVLVPASLHAEVGDLFRELVAASAVADPWAADTALGPVIDTASSRRLESLVAGAADRRTTRGRASGAVASEVPATVVMYAQPGDAVCAQELFGPVLPLIGYPDDDLDSCVRIANGTEYGLASYVFGTDQDRVDAVVRKLDFGMTAVNRGSVSHPKAPFGGLKHSGFGRENGRIGLAEYLDLHTVHEPIAVQP